jgi:sec-independent protein translocase protein TatA
LGAFQPWHWVILLLVVVILFGSKRLPDAARSLGKSMRIFKSEVKELQSEQKGNAAVTPAQPPIQQVQSDRLDVPVIPAQPAPVIPAQPAPVIPAQPAPVIPAQPAPPTPNPSA